MQQKHTKKAAVLQIFHAKQQLLFIQSIGFDTIASGDSYNDLGMIQASKAGFLFRSTEQIKADHPELPAYETYDELLTAIKDAMK